MVRAQARVTVGMPVYNDPAGLRLSVPTVFNQTWDGDVRLVVVDDGSDDDTPEVLAELAAAYGRVEIVRNAENRGRPYARNQIIERAGDGWLAWLDAGDLWHPRKLELQFAAMGADGAESEEMLLCTTPLRRHFYDRGAESIRRPAIDGDQLYNALTGGLYPYLQTMLGQAQDFRAVGGFDERLLRRQDYDFLVRFLDAGGRVISTSDDPPLVTYLKSDVGADAATVAAVNRVIRREHADIYDRYGPDLARRVRRNQHLLVARFYGNNGHRVWAALYRAAARLARPPRIREWGRRALRSMLRPLRGPLRGAMRLTSRALRPLLPLLRRWGLTSLARRLGIVRALASLGLMRTFYREVGTGETPPAGPPAPAGDAASERPGRPRGAGADASDVHRAIRDGEYDAAVAELEPRLEAGADRPEVWLLLEEAHRRAGRRRSAQDALERGLERHPRDRRLEVRLVELLALRREWPAATKRWFDLVADGRDDLTPLSYARVSRSLRMLENSERALEVAEEGLERWPADRRLTDEFHRSRASVVDWAEAVVVSRATIGSRETPEPIGTVTDAGFMSGSDGPVRGWVRTRGEVSPRVSLRVNGRPVASTNATAMRGPAGEHAAGFSLNCRGILEYLGDGDVVGLTCTGAPIAIEEGGTRWIVAPGFDSRSDVLAGKLDEGHVFTKFGNLALAYTPARKQQILTLHDEIAAFVEERFGYAVFPLYGNLLGAIRDHDFIGHDVGGFDVGYVSAFSDPEAVREEVLRICAGLVAGGYHLDLNPWSVYVRRSQGDPALVDLNFAWFTAAGELHLSYGWRFSPVTDRERLFTHRECPIAGHLVRVPGNAEAVLEQLYGADWAVPIQGFDPGAGITRDPSYLLSEAEMTRLASAHPDNVRIMRVLGDDEEQDL